MTAVVVPRDLGAAATQRSTGRRVLHHMRSYWRGIAAILGFGSAASTLTVLHPWPIKLMIDGVLVGTTVDLGPLGTITANNGPERLRAIALLALLYLAIVLAGAAFGGIAMYAITNVALDMIHDLRRDLLAHLRKLSMRFHANQSVGDSIWRAVNDARGLQEVVGYGVGAFCVPFLRLVMMVLLMALLDPILTVVALGLAPFFVAAMRMITKRIQRASLNSRENMSRLTTLIEQTLVTIRAVQVFGRESREEDRFHETSRAYVASQLRFRLWEQLLATVTVSLTGIGSAAVLYVSARRVVDGHLTVGSLWIFVSYMQGLYSMVNQLISVYGPYQDALVGLARAYELLDVVPDVAEPTGPVAKCSFENAIRFRGVQLEYEPGTPVLQGLDLVVTRGEHIVVVGETGSGKSSLLGLLPRLHDPTGGSVEIDGIDLRRLTLRSLRDLISVVPQDPLLFAASIRENLLYGHPGATQDDIERAVAAARARDFIEALPFGYDTTVGERGERLSTGQQQRISIARAFLKDAPLLLLDEPTSALDVATEREVLDGLDELMAGRTVFLVTHRLSMIRANQRVLVLAGGGIAEDGRHEELVVAGGPYSVLWRHQTAR